MIREDKLKLVLVFTDYHKCDWKVWKPILSWLPTQDQSIICPFPFQLNVSLLIWFMFDTLKNWLATKIDFEWPSIEHIATPRWLHHNNILKEDPLDFFQLPNLLERFIFRLRIILWSWWWLKYAKFEFHILDCCSYSPYIQIKTIIFL